MVFCILGAAFATSAYVLRRKELPCCGRIGAAIGQTRVVCPLLPHRNQILSSNYQGSVGGHHEEDQLLKEVVPSNRSSQAFWEVQGFDEYMNLVLDDAEEVNVKKNIRKPLGRILLKGDNITLMQNTGK
ncbi:hypothetical protein Taro_004144 [Colocasia esculenta]|uniref:Small nuclear ribonucleoprotein E n=1 Tax=Colocasia esculenta TaxID=4460 RepID=A0A843TQU3_COLES|nr:hypothetical protein [Colocasia esculenta]